MSHDKDVTILYVPLKPYIKQYFEKENGAGGKVLVRQNTMLGMLVLLCTEKTSIRFRPKKPANRKDLLALQLPARMKHYTMRDDQREKLTEVLEKLFHEKLYDFIRSQSAVTGSEWAAIRCFADLYELDTETFDPHKIYKLWRDRKNTITNDNRESTQSWYETNRVMPDGVRDYSRASSPELEQEQAA